MTWEDVSFVARSKNRKLVLEALSKPKSPKTPTQLSNELSLNLGYISNILIELIDRKLIECLTPNEKRYRLYRLTNRGKDVLKKLGEID